MMNVRRLLFSILLLATVFFLAACNLNANDKKLVDEAYETLAIGYQSPDNDLSVTKDITLVDKVNEVTITWASSLPNVITLVGEVTRQDDDVIVTLTATLTKGKAILTKTFSLVVIGIEETVTNKVPESHEDVKTDRASLNLTYSTPSALGQSLNTLQKIAFLRSLDNQVLIDPNTSFSLKSEGFMKQIFTEQFFVEYNSYINTVNELNFNYEISLEGRLNETLSASDLSADLLFKYAAKSENTYKDVLSSNGYSLAFDGAVYLNQNKAYLDGVLKAFGNDKGALIEFNDNITEGVENFFTIFDSLIFENIFYPDLSIIDDQSLTEIFDTLKTLKIYKVGESHIISYQFNEEQIANLFGEEIGDLPVVFDSELNLIIKIDQDKKLKSIYIDTNLPVFAAVLFGDSFESESNLTLEVVFDTNQDPTMPDNLDQYQEIDLTKFEELEEILSLPIGTPIDRIYERGQNIHFVANEDYYFYYEVEVIDIYSTHYNRYSIYIERDLLELDNPGTHTYSDGEYQFEYTIVEEIDFENLKGVYKVIGETEKDVILYAFLIEMGNAYYFYHYFSEEALSDQQLFDLYGSLDIDYKHLAYINYHHYYDVIYLQGDNINNELRYSGDGFYARNYEYYGMNSIYGEFAVYQKIEGQTSFPKYKAVMKIEIIEDNTLFDLEIGIDSFISNTFLVTYDDDTTEVITYTDFYRINYSIYGDYDGLYVEVTFRYKNYYYHETFDIKMYEVDIASGGYLVIDQYGNKYRVIIVLKDDHYELWWTSYYGNKNIDDVVYEDFDDPITYFHYETKLFFTANKAFDIVRFSSIGHLSFYEYDLQIDENGFIIEHAFESDERFSFIFVEEIPSHLDDFDCEIEVDIEN